MMLDKEKVKKRFESSLGTYEASASVQETVSEKLFQMVVATTTLEFKRILEIGCGTGYLTRKLIHRFSEATYFINDISCAVKPYIENVFLKKGLSDPTFLFEDAEQLEIPTDCDLIVSSSALQWLTDFSAFAVRLSAVTSEGNMFAFSSYGEDNFKEINHLGAGLKYLSLEEISSRLTCAGFEILAREEEHIPLRFDSYIDMLKHIKNTGATGSSRSGIISTVRKHLQEQQKNQTSVTLTYHPIYLVARKVGK